MRHLLLVVAIGCSKSDPPAPPPEPAPVHEPAPAPIKIQPTADRGSCTVKATGAFTASETMPGGKPAVISKYWMSDAERGNGAPPGFIVNCSGKDLRLSII